MLVGALWAHIGETIEYIKGQTTQDFSKATLIEKKNNNNIK